ncbi:MAG: efflux RND transporter periplasmic adaptor subunit [Pirellulaceae bacterium]|nr:efflux RND transporter periplasmic adaptor subunit [Pirellulaceae bacterium]
MTGRSCPAMTRVALVLALVAAGCSEPQERAAPPPPKVTVGRPVAREVLEEADFNGWLRAAETVEVRARVRGHIQKIHFQDGDLVAKDQLLFELDPRPFQVQIDQAIAQGQAYDAQKVAAEKDVARFEVLVKENAASKQQLEKAIADAASYDAQISAKAEEVKQYELDLEFSRITAPIAGRISRAMLSEGNLVNAGGSDPLLTTIVSLDPIHVYFSVDERTVQRLMRERQQAGADEAVELRERKVPFRFGLDSDVGFPHEGLIDFADNQINPETGTIEVRGVVDNQQGKFVSGSRVRVRVPLGKPYAAVLVPDSAILADQDKRYLLVLDDQNVVARRNISPGKLLDDGMRVVVPEASGGGSITTDDRIIVLGLQRARINYPVDPVEESPQPVEQPGQPPAEGEMPASRPAPG